MIGAPYIVGSDSSYAAALAMQHELGRLESVVLAFLKKRPEGALDEQMQALLHMNPNTQRPRRVSLVEKGLVRDSGRKARTWAGRLATVWEAT